MQFIEILYLISSFVALSACVPQLHQLIRTRETAELSLQAWGMWSMTHVISLIYFVSLQNIILVFMGAAWTVFYVAMTYLIIHFRHLVPQPVIADVPAEEHEIA